MQQKLDEVRAQLTTTTELKDTLATKVADLEVVVAKYRAEDKAYDIDLRQKLRQFRKDSEALGRSK